MKMKRMNPRIAVLIPCYNEEITVRAVVKGFQEVLPDADIYVYDNNSTDRTAEIAAEAGAIVCRQPQQGKGNVVRAMFRQIEADCYLMVDGDDTYPAENAPEMVRLVLEEGADMVIGDRLSSTYFTENKRPFHNTGNRLVRGLINTLFHSHLRDILTGYRAFSRSFVKGFPVLSGGFEIETEMSIHALDKNFMIREIPVNYKDRPAGSESKLNTLQDGARVLKTIAILMRDYRPGTFFGVLGSIPLLIGLLFLLPVFREYFCTGLVPRFPTLICSIGMILIGVLLYMVGLILSCVVKKHRQLYELMLTQLSLPVSEIDRDGKNRNDLL